MADIIPFRLITLDPGWVHLTTDCIALKIDGGEMDTVMGHTILFTIAEVPLSGIIMMCKVFEDSDDIQVVMKKKSTMRDFGDILAGVMFKREGRSV